MLSLDSVSVDSSVAKLDSSSEDPGDALEYLPPDDLLHGGPLAGGARRAGGAPPLAPPDVPTVCTAVHVALSIAATGAC